MAEFKKRDSGDRKMYPAVCSECKQKCEVPFKPSNDESGKPRPVYCRECFRKRRRY